MKIVKPPKQWNQKTCEFSVFLAGSIELGKAVNWQSKVEEFLTATKFSNNIIVLNPRRDNWDDSWKQSITDKNFNEQVTWELDSQERCDINAIFFDPKTKAPISLLELGLFHDKNVVVCCPDGFYRKGNVEITCRKYGIVLTSDMKTFVKEIYKKIEILNNFIEK